MAAILFTMPSRVLDANADPYSGALAYFYATGTTTPQAAFTTAALNVAHTNPVVADSAGKFPTIYLNPALIYRCVIKNSTGSVTLHDIDPYNPGLDDAVSVRAYGAVGDGTTDDIAAFTAALAAHTHIYIPKGTYKLSTAVALGANNTLTGDGSNATVLAFTGATNGLTIASGFRTLALKGLQIRTSSASGGKALYVQNGSAGYVEDIQITSTGAGRWAFGLWANGWQTSNLYGVRMANPSSVGGPSVTVGVHLEYGCNALQFYGLEVIGSSGAGTVERAIQLSGANSLGAGTDAFDVYFHGGTFQGYFTKSVLYTTNASPIMFGCHPENTNATPSDGADFWLDGTTVGAIVNPKFTGFQGGSFGTTGPVRNLGLTGGEVGNVTIGANCLCANLVDLRCGTLTDTGAQTTIIGVSDGAGAAVGAAVSAPTFRHRISGSTLWGGNAKGFGYAAAQFATVTQATSKATGVTANFPLGEITMHNAALAGDTTVSFAFTNSTIEDNDYLLIQHVSGGTAGCYLVNALCAAGSATINVRNITPGSLGEAIVLGFTLIKGTIAA